MLKKFIHPNIVKVIDFINNKKEICFILEYNIFYYFYY